MPDSVHFIPNRPEELRLKEPEGMIDGWQVHYKLQDGRILKVSNDVAVMINQLELQPGESFWICKDRRGTGAMGLGTTIFRVWLSPETEQLRAVQEDEALRRQLTRGLANSIEQAKQHAAEPITTPTVKPPRKPTRKPHAHASTPQLITCGTGTDGPAPLPHIAIAPAVLTNRPTRPTIPYNVAFAEVTAFVTRGLEQAREQWNDEAKQGMVSTILIAAAKQGLLSLWER
jgi:hypothetical protein